MKPLVIIPARYASTRFPGKPLVEIDGKPMVQHVYERAKKVVQDVYVATDDERIAKAVADFGGLCVMTKATHPSGTDRCAEAMDKIKGDFDVVINVQGDEPFLNPKQIDKIIDCFKDPATQIATLITPIEKNDTLFDYNKVKVVCDKNNFALYFSRNPIPFQRDTAREDWLGKHDYFLHLGIYGFKQSVLEQLARLQSTPLEQMEKLEQLRWLEHGLKIKTATTNQNNFGIDTPEDLKNI